MAQPIWSPAVMGGIYTTDDVAEWLKVDVVTVRRMIARGEISAVRVGSEYRFTQQDLADFIKQQRVRADPNALRPEETPDAAGEASQSGPLSGEPR